MDGVDQSMNSFPPPRPYAVPRLALPLLLLLLLAQASSNSAAESMTWVMPDFPPASIPVDGKPTNGMADQVVRYIVSKWPGVEHRYLYANAKRTWQMLAQGEQVCYAAALRTREREKIAYFSNTSMLAPPSLVVRAPEQAALPLNSAGDADFAAVLAQRGPQRLRGLLVEQRSYGAMIDALVAGSAPELRPDMLPASDYGQNIFKMIVQDRADYTVDYDFTLSFEQAHLPELAGLKTVPVAGNAAPVITGVACPRTAWGRATIIKVDRMLGTKEGADALMKAQNQWHTEGARQRYAAQFADFAKHRAKPSPAADFK